MLLFSETLYQCQEEGVLKPFVNIKYNKDRVGNTIPLIFGLRQPNLVLIAFASSEGSGGRAVSPEPLLLAHTSSESRGTFRQKARSPAPLNGWACAVKICHDGMLEDTNSLDAPYITNSPKGNNRSPESHQVKSLKYFE